MDIHALGIFMLVAMICRGDDTFQTTEHETGNGQLILSAISEVYADHPMSDQRILDMQEPDTLLTEDQGRSPVKHSLHGNLANHARKKRKAIRKTKYRWSGNVVPYLIPTGTFSKHHEDMIRDGIEEWQKYTCLRFVPWTPGTPNFIAFVNGNRCVSKVGMRKRLQYIRLGSRCISKRLVLHEIGHALGFHHEHSRPDRNEYVEIVWENIRDGEADNFLKRSYRNVNLYGVPYDYNSIMHYHGTAWSKNGKPTIITSDTAYQKKIGKGDNLSFYDIKLANLMYSCDKTCPDSIVCPGEGFLGKDCTCYCPGDTIQLCSDMKNSETSQLTTNPELPCRDKWTEYDCRIAAWRGLCLSGEADMKMNCNATCKLCEVKSVVTHVNPTTTPTTTSYVYTGAMSTKSSLYTGAMSTKSSVSTGAVSTKSSLYTGAMSTKSYVSTGAMSTKSYASTGAMSTKSSASTGAMSTKRSTSTGAMLTKSSVSTGAMSTKGSVSTGALSTKSYVSTGAMSTKSSTSTGAMSTKSSASIGAMSTSRQITKGSQSTSTTSTPSTPRPTTTGHSKSTHSKPSKTCRDKADTGRCRIAAHKGYCWKYRNYMETYCTASCNFCRQNNWITTDTRSTSRRITKRSQPTSHLTTTSTLSTPPPTTTGHSKSTYRKNPKTCRDKADTHRCRLAAKIGYCLKYRHYMETYCTASCNICQQKHWKKTNTPSTSRHITTDTPSTSRHITTDTPSTSRHKTTDTPSTSRHITTDTPSTSHQITTDTPSTSRHITTGTSSTSRHKTTDTPSTSRHITTDTSSTPRPTTTGNPKSTYRKNPKTCHDKTDTRRCRIAARTGYCLKYRNYMETYCAASCNLC